MCGSVRNADRPPKFVNAPTSAPGWPTLILMIWYSNWRVLRHGGARPALSFTGVLLLAACATGTTQPTRPAAQAIAAHRSVEVDQRTLAQAEADEQKRQLEEARDTNVAARRNAQHLQRQIEGLEAEVIDSGLLLTLDDALFAGNSARLNAAGSERLDKLISFLDEYRHRDAQIEDSAVCKASAGYDATLSQRRAAAVASYVLQRGIDSARLSVRASARSEQQPASFADDCDAPELHLNRQVVVLIEDAMTSAREP